MSQTKWILLAALAFLILSTRRRRDRDDPARNLPSAGGVLTPDESPPPISVPYAPLPTAPINGELIQQARTLRFPVLGVDNFRTPLIGVDRFR